MSAEADQDIYRCGRCREPLGVRVMADARPRLVVGAVSFRQPVTFDCRRCGHSQTWYPTVPRLDRPQPLAVEEG